MSESNKEQKPLPAATTVLQVEELAKADRQQLLERAKAAGPPIKQKVLVNGKVKQITVYSLRPLLKG